MANSDIQLDNLNLRQSSETVVDDGTITLPSAKTGWGFVQIGNNQEFTGFQFTSAAAVTLFNNSTNVASSDSDGNLCVYDGGTSVILKNRLGSSLTVRYFIWYS